jgi:hypothetical protein
MHYPAWLKSMLCKVVDSMLQCVGMSWTLQLVLKSQCCEHVVTQSAEESRQKAERGAANGYHRSNRYAYCTRCVSAQSTSLLGGTPTVCSQGACCLNGRAHCMSFWG